MSVRPGAEPYAHDGDDVGVLLCHGFTGNPAGLRPWAEAVAAAGHTVRVPRLPGHGTSWQEMGKTTWADWYGELDAAFAELRARSRVVVAGGLSMGGGLALRLAQQHPADGGAGVDALVLVNAAVKVEDRRLKALPVLRWVLPWLPPVGNDIKKPGVVEDAYDKIPPHAVHSMLAGYRTVVSELPAVKQPVLLFRSPQDRVVPASSSALILDRVSSTDTEEVLLEDSFHVATLDNDAPMIFQRTVSFIDRIANVSHRGKAMSSGDPEPDSGPDAEHPTPEPEPLDIDSAFAAIVAGWADESPSTWPAEEDLTQGRHRRVDDDPQAGSDPEDPPDRDDRRALAGSGGPMVPSVEPAWEGPEDDIGRADAFVPPEPPPLPRGDAISRVAWAGVVLGPILLLISVIWQHVPQIIVLAALAGFVGGFVTLVARMPKHRDEDGDDGAVV